MYNKIINIIGEYLSRDIVKSDDIIVSAYDLYMIIYMSLEDLFLIYEEYHEKFKIKRNFVDYKLVNEYGDKKYRNVELSKMIIELDYVYGHLVIELNLDLYFDKNRNYFGIRYKKFIDDDYVFINNNLTTLEFKKNFYEENREYINYIFSVVETFLENYVDKENLVYHFSIRNLIPSYIFKDDYFQIKYNIGSGDNKLVLDMSFFDEKLYDAFFNKYINKENLYLYFNERKEEVLKRIGIEVSKLPEVYKNLVYNYYNSINVPVPKRRVRIKDDYNE